MRSAIGRCLALTAPCVALAQVIPDKNLEAAVRKYVFEKKDNDKPITEADLRNVFVLEAKGKKIKDLAGLQHCANLSLFDLENNEVSDLTPLRDLGNLQSLNLARNRISDLSPLSKLSNLQYLELSHNQITEAGPIAALTQLNSLYLTGNRIKDPGPLKSCERLWTLYLGENPLAGLDALGGFPRVSTLELRGCGLADLSPLKGMKELHMLFLEKNKIETLASFVEMVRKDAEGEKRFAPFLQVWLKDNPLTPDALSKHVPALKGFGVKVHLEKPVLSRDGHVEGHALAPDGLLSVTSRVARPRTTIRSGSHSM